MADSYTYEIDGAQVRIDKSNSFPVVIDDGYGSVGLTWEEWDAIVEYVKNMPR